MAMTNRYGPKVSPYITPASIRKASVSRETILSNDSSHGVFLHGFHKRDNRLRYSVRIFMRIPLCTLSKAFLKSMNNKKALRFLSLAPSKILLRHSMWLVVLRPSRNPFWLILRIFSIAGLIL